MISNRKSFNNVLGLGILLVCVFTLGIFVGRNYNVSSSSFSLSSTKQLDMTMFWKVFDIAKSDYVDEDSMDEEGLVYGAIKGMLDSLGDPATVFLTPEETEEFNSATEGKYFEGIGAELGYYDGRVVVVTPLEGSPAKEAGIRPGDYIVKVDDYEVTLKDTVYDIVAKIRGDSGTEVVITILHRGDTEVTDMKIVRREITVPSMTLEYVGKDSEVALLKVSRFTESTYSDWTKIWDEKVNEIVSKGKKKVILDLRGNPGGYFDSAIYAADDFLDKGFVISKHRDARGNIKDYNSSRGGKLLDVELVVLVNTGSASASEILSGALQSASRAKIIGEDTFGKGTAQKIYDLSDGSTLHLTVMKWLLPDGRQIDKDNAVKPDYEVSLTEEDFKQGLDPQLNKALEIISK